tara:strand:+ start:488 stop:748 length:261 start_codon:yes stop_codon:yes gene_type:complete
MDDIYLNTFSKDLRNSIKKKLTKSDRGDNDLEEVIDKLTKQKEYLQEQLRKAGLEIKNLEAEVKYERQLRIGGTKYHVNQETIKIV